MAAPRMDGSSAFGPVLKHYRLSAGLTQEALAERALLSPRGIQDLERGVIQRPRRDTVERLVAALKLDATDRAALETAACGPLLPAGRTGPARVAARDHPLPVGGYLGARPPGRLVGRDGELDQALACLEVVRAGEGKLLQLSGEPGVGKTRLAQEVAVRASECGFLVAAGSCYESRQTVPYYPFLDALGALYTAAPAAISAVIPEHWPQLARLLPNTGLPLPPTSSGPQEEQERMFRAAAGFIAAISRTIPLAILLDDLHWADEVSLSLLQHLARHTSGERVFLFGTYRDGEVVPGRPLTRTLHDLRRDGLLEQLTLWSLGKDGTAALIMACLGEERISPKLTELIYGTAEGHPFFTQEVLRTLVERGDVFAQDGVWDTRGVERVEVPETVRSVIEERVTRLSDGTQALLHDGSILGQTFHFDDLQGMSGRTEEMVEDALQEATHAGVVRALNRDNYTFNHALTQHALYADLPPRRQTRLHLAAGEALERLPERMRVGRSVDLARHFLEAGRPERALPYVMAMGEHAEEVFAHREAERHYRTALNLAQQIGDEGRTAEALERLGDVIGSLGHFREALQRLDDAARLDRARGDLEGKGRVVARIGRIHRMRGRPLDGLARTQTMIDELSVLGPSRALAVLHETLVHLLYELGRHDEQLAAAERMAEIARAIGDEPLLASAMVHRAWGLGMVGRYDQLIQAAARAMPLLESAGRIVELRFALDLTGVAYYFRGEYSSARTHEMRALALAEQIGDPILIVDIVLQLGWIAWALGSWGEARAYARRADALLERVEDSLYSGGSFLLEGYICVAEGAWGEAEECLERVADLARSNENRGMLLGSQYGLATLDLRREHPQETIARLEPMLVSAADDVRMPVFPLLAEAHLAMGQRCQAENLVAEAIDWAQTEQNRLTWAEALRVQGLLLTEQRRGQEAHLSFTEALKLTRFMCTPWLEARILEAEAMTHAQAGDLQQARERLVDSLAIFQQLGAAKDVERTQGVLSGLSRPITELMVAPLRPSTGAKAASLPSMSRGDLTDEQWERLRPLLPPQTARHGRPPKDHRRIVNGVLWVLRTGAPWRDLPERYGPWQTVATRFYRWRRTGIWDRILAELKQQADAEGTLDWTLHHVDGTMIRAHQRAAGAQKRGSIT